VSVDEAYYHTLVEDAQLIKKVRAVLKRRQLDKTSMVSELRDLVMGSDKPSVKLHRRGRGADLEAIRKPFVNLRPHTESLSFHMKKALLAPVFDGKGNTARALAHRDLAVQKRGEEGVYVRTTLGERVAMYLKLQGESS
jgi:hypothetical protein